MCPDFEPETIAPKLFRPPEDWSRRGQMSRLLLGILRTAKAPMTTREIAAQMILQRAVAGAPRRRAQEEGSAVGNVSTLGSGAV